MYEIKLIPNEELDIILPLLQIRYEKKPIEVLQPRIQAIKDHNYLCVGVFDQGKLIAISGIWVLFKFYVGKHIEPDTVVVHPDYRGKKIGDMLMHWVHDFAVQNGCEASELNVYVTNPRGVKFWMNQGYRIAGFHMRRDF